MSVGRFFEKLKNLSSKTQEQQEQARLAENCRQKYYGKLLSREKKVFQKCHQGIFFPNIKRAFEMTSPEQKTCEEGVLAAYFKCVGKS